MTSQALYDKLLELRLPAFREALREQQDNPQYTELSFEERLSLLVDQECTRRRENRVRRCIQAAGFPMQAALEELDLSPARGLERRTVLELGQCNWIVSHYNLIILGPTGGGKTFLACAFGTAAARAGFATCAPPACCIPCLFPTRMALSLLSCVPWPKPACSSSMTGCEMPSLSKTPRICSKSSTTASDIPPPSSLHKSLSLIGIYAFQTLLWRMPPSTALSTTLNVCNCKVNPNAS